MAIDPRNCNTLWASVLVETLARVGLTTAVICPGSRPGPLATAFALHETIQAIPILDERSAAFFALGVARRTGRPAALVCTSGTAGANFYPAVIEAYESRVPLIVLTADRPPELRHCHAGQAIDQLKLYGHYPNWQAELALPELSHSQLTYLRQTLIYAWERSHVPTPGPVHLNCPFRDPLAPIADAVTSDFANTLNVDAFFHGVQPILLPRATIATHALPLQDWLACDRGVIIAGPAQPQDPEVYSRAIANLAQTLNWPVFAEGLSPIRNAADLNPNLIATYGVALKNPSLADGLRPDQVIRVGELPTSKELRQWLAHLDGPQWVIDPGDRNLDPLHANTIALRTDIEQIAEAIASLGSPAMTSVSESSYLSKWLDIEQRIRANIKQTMIAVDHLWESKLSWILPNCLPPSTPVFIANSMPVRDVEWVWPLNNSRIQPYCNRGANGIDGTLSTALGVAHAAPPSVLLTGDLSLLHDTNGFLQTQEFQGHLTILLINNDGGGIFGMLPIGHYDPPFERFFVTPQRVDIPVLCQAYGVEYENISVWSELVERLNPLPTSGIRVLEIQCDRCADIALRKHWLEKWSTQ